ncbi:MAG: thioredoxin [Gemmatimonadetes bacterium]|nr:thioredoxin [Gemmatimonadota bacterium]MCY3678683.1 thioredoxin [Gemmatimonadota bacterium]
MASSGGIDPTCPPAARTATPPPPRFVAVVKDDCETCHLVAPVLGQIVAAGYSLKVYWQDDDAFLPASLATVDDRDLEHSFRLDIVTVPTLIRLEGQRERGRTEGWDAASWRTLTGLATLGEELPSHRPGCGSRSVDPGVPEVLRVRYGETGIRAREVVLGDRVDPTEACYDRGWTDGLPVVPPTPERILRMLAGTRRDPHEIVGRIPPDMAPCTVEKVAINAVMAGCKPEYLPVVLTALQAALDPRFTLHGVTCSTCFSSPVVIVNGPVAKRLGMNSGMNALGQGNRANATIGRALNLVVRNVGGGRPGEIDRATLGTPGKYTFCFAEDESDDGWTPLAEARGIAPGSSAVTVFAGDGVQGVWDQKARTPAELTRSLAMALSAVGHPKLCEWVQAILVLSPEHYAIYRGAGWHRDRITADLQAALSRPGAEVVAGADGVAEGMPHSRRGEQVPKFHPDGLLLVRAGGPAGLMSAILSGWPGGRDHEESHPITREISE